MKPKVDEVVNSLSSAPPSEKSSEDEDDKEDEKVCNTNWYFAIDFSVDRLWLCFCFSLHFVLLFFIVAFFCDVAINLF